METIETPETLIEGLSAPKQGEIENLFSGSLTTGSQSFDLGKEGHVEPVCAPVAENGCVDPCKVNSFNPVETGSHEDVSRKGISLVVKLTGGVIDKPDRESVCDVNTALPYESWARAAVDQQECEISVGDLVWAVIRRQKQSWWPGIVCDVADVPKEAANQAVREDDILVRCFGNGNLFWCSPCEVKPFYGYFNQLPSQSQAKKFLDALEKAVIELGHRVDKEFTCSCFCNGKAEKKGKFGELLLARFEPTTFLNYIRDLGKSLSMVNKIDHVVKQSCLSAFYRSLGHLQIPMDQLKPANGTPLKIKNEEENGRLGDGLQRSYQPRERRKSGFLLYPGESESETEELKVEMNGQSQPIKKPRKKWTKKNKVVPPNLCSSEVLSELKLAAQSCSSPCESKNFDSVEQFISGFRKQAFCDSSNVPVEVLNHQIQQESLPKKARKKDKSVISPALGDRSSPHTDIQNLGLFKSEAQSMQNTRSEWPASQAAIFNYGNLPMTQRPACKLEPLENNAPMPTWHAGISTVPATNGHVEGLYQVPPVLNFTNELGSNPPCFTGNHGEPQMCTVPTALGHVPKKRGRKRKNIGLHANPASTEVPNLNPNEKGVEPKKEKRVKRSKEIGVPCIDLSYVKVQQDDLEVKGTAFLLKFSSDYPLPSNQDLNSVFSKYGALIESETQVSNENLCGQVVFLDSHSAGGAFWGLQNDKPFGPVLVNYKIQHLAGPESAVPTVLFRTPLNSPTPPKPIETKAIGPPVIPDLNTNLTTSPTKVQILKNSNMSEEIQLPSNDHYLSYNKVHQGNGDVTGAALLLKFSPNHPLPTVHDLNSIFYNYGKLNETETLVSGQNFTGQVVYLNASSAGDAIHRLEKDQPFGPALLSYRVHHLYNAQPVVRDKNPVNNLKPPQDLGVIKRNLEMMNLMLEKSGNSLSPEMRKKLESEIKGLMNKVSAMNGSSSSSSCL